MMNKIKTITDEIIYHETLANGLPVYVMPKPGFKKKYAMFATNYGSLDSQFTVGGQTIKVPDGIAHFLEHKMFEEEDIHVFDRFADYGASVNAYTSYTITTYLFSTTDNFSPAFQELLRFVQSAYLTEENVAKEKGIIEQELRMYDDDPDRRIYRNLLTALYHKHPIKLDVGGTVASIQDINVENLTQCYQLFYQPQNMSVFAIGDFDPQEVVNLAADATRNWRYEVTDVKRIYPEEPREIVQAKIEQKLSVSQPRYYLGFKDQPQATGTDLLKQHVAMGMIWRMLAAKSSPVYEALYDQGVIDDSFGASFQATPSYAFSLVGGETDEPEKLDQQLRTAITKLQKNKISAADVERMKRRSLGNYIAAFDSLEYIANSFINHQFNDTSFIEIPHIIESITADDVNSYLLGGLNLDYSAVSLILPE